MDMLKIPTPLRRLILSHPIVRRCSLSTAVHPGDDGLPWPPVTSGSPALLTLSSTTLNSYRVGLPPNSAQLQYANGYFTAAPPAYLFTAAHFRSFPPSSHPEVAFLGRSNVGKSSLLNALFGRTKVKDAHVSKRPGRTRTMNGFGITGGMPMGAMPKEGERESTWKRFPRGGLIVVDMPGYGSGSREDWGKEIMKYLENRKQLRRTFVLVDAEHGLKATDVQLLLHLRRQGISHQIVLSKVDKLLHPHAKAPGPQKLSNSLLKVQDMCEGIRQRLKEEAGDGRDSQLDILSCSAERSLGEAHKHRKLGIDEVRWAVLSACNLECDEQGQRKQAVIYDIPVLDEHVT